MTDRGVRALPLLGIAFVLVWCTGYLAGKIVVTQAAAATALVWRFGSAALLFGLLAWIGRASWGSLRDARRSALVGVLMLAMQFGGVYLGLQLGATAGVAALVIGAMPLLVSLMVVVGGMERLRGVQWFGLLLGFCGVLLVVADRVDGATPWPAWLALLLGLVGISAGTLYQKRQAPNVDLRAGLALQNLAATVVLLPFALLLEGFRFAPTHAFFGATAWLVLVNSLGGFALLFVLIRRDAATSVAALFFLVPPVTAVLGHLVLGEHFTALKMAGFACAALGVWLATRRVA